MNQMIIPDPNIIFPNEYHTSCFIKNVVTAPNILIGDYTYYDDPDDPTGFEQNNVLFNYPEFGDRLIIGKFCAIASKTQFIMGPANHRISSVTTYPFNVFGGAWEANTPPHLSQLPHKGDTIIGNDVWIGYEIPYGDWSSDVCSSDLCSYRGWSYHRCPLHCGKGYPCLHCRRRKSRKTAEKAV